jgi:hypothetical protein
MNHVYRYLVILLLIPASLPAASGHLEIVEGTTRDWGRIEGGWNFGVVTLENRGDAELILEDITVGCSCTRIDSSDARWAGEGRSIPPGGRRELHIAMDLSGYDGPIHKSVTICTTEGMPTKTTITFIATVAPTIKFVPSQNILALHTHYGMESPASMKIVNTGSKPFVISPPTLEPGQLAVRFVMTEPKELLPGETFVLEAFITPRPEMSLYRSATIATTNPEMPSIELFISAVVDR